MSFLDSTGVAALTADIKTITDATYPANAAIALAYDSTAAYSVGDCCMKDGLLYVCNTAIASGGETWNSSHWTQVNVATLVSQIHGLPTVTSSDNGKSLVVSSGAWTVAMDGMVILSYGSSTWGDFIDAYNANKVVYCRASSNANPATGAQGRMAFMAYVNASPPTNVEFQYYRSVNSHSATQQGDQTFVYKLDKTSGWSVTTRENYTKIVAGTGLSSSYSSGTLTLTNSQTVPDAATATPLMDGTAVVGTATKYAREDHVHPTDTSKQDVLVSGTNIKTINNNSILGSGDITITGGGDVQTVNGISPDANGDVEIDTVYVGTSAPSDPAIQIWLDTDEPGMSAVSSVNGATGTVVLDADDVGAMHWDLLWENASPMSSFSPQTISLDLSSYDLVMVLFLSYTDSDTALLSSFALIDSTIGYNRNWLFYGWHNGPKLGQRPYYVTSSGVEFSTGLYAGVTSNANAVPVKIYGIKGVVTS